MFVRSIDTAGNKSKRFTFNLYLQKKRVLGGVSPLLTDSKTGRNFKQDAYTSFVHRRIMH
jgi:hypothetical protein